MIALRNSTRSCIPYYPLFTHLVPEKFSLLERGSFLCKSLSTVDTKPINVDFVSKKINELDYLSDLTNSRTKAFLAAETSNFSKYAARSATKVETLFALGRKYVPVQHVEVPERYGKGVYFSMHDEDEELGTMCRIRDVSNLKTHDILNPSTSTPGFERLVDMRTIVEDIFGDDQTKDQIEFLRLGEVKLSRDESRLAFTIAFNAGDEAFEGYIKLLDPPTHCWDLGNSNFEPCILGASTSPIGVPDDVLSGINNIELDNRNPDVVYYTASDPLTFRPDKVFRRTVGQSRSEDELLFHEQDPLYSVDICSSKCGDYLFINSHSKSTSEVRVLPHGTPSSTPTTIVQPRQSGMEYFVEKMGSSFIVASNWQSEELSIFHVPIERVLAGEGSCDNWTRIPLKLSREESDGAAECNGIIEELDCFRDNLVLYVRQGAEKSILVGASADGLSPPSRFTIAKLPPWCTSVEPGNNTDYNSETLRLRLSSPTHPETAWDVDLSAPQLGPTECRPMSPPPREKCSPAATATAHDRLDTARGTGDVITEHRRSNGVPPSITPEIGDVITEHRSVGPNGVPLSITRERSPSRATEHRQVGQPTLLRVYGAYGHSLPLGFSPMDRVLLDRGWALATAHVRGGGEKGRSWYQDGKLMNKWNTFHDLALAAEHLVDSGVTSPELLTARAHSAGCLALGVACNTVPDLFRAMVMNMPFLDVLAAMLDETLPLTVPEFEEWGDPASGAEAFQYIASYDPVLNLPTRGSHGRLPDLYMTASLEDLRVPFWGPAKYVHRVREENHGADEAPLVVLDVSSDSHFGAGGRLMQLYEEAKYAAFLEQAVQTERS